MIMTDITYLKLQADNACFHSSPASQGVNRSLTGKRIMDNFFPGSDRDVPAYKQTKPIIKED